MVAGYTVLQPRVEIAPHGSDSLFARLFGGDTAIDIYSRAVSDVYQDLFGSGNYVGKGIYDVAAFNRSLEGRVPENNLLSHDLWEGLHGRTGLVTDIIVYESFPESYSEYVRRWHRWVRGDWQLLPWLLPHSARREGTRLKNRLTLLRPLAAVGQHAAQPGAAERAAALARRLVRASRPADVLDRARATCAQRLSLH